MAESGSEQEPDAPLSSAGRRTVLLSLLGAMGGAAALMRFLGNPSPQLSIEEQTREMDRQVKEIERQNEESRKKREAIDDMIREYSNAPNDRKSDPPDSSGSKPAGPVR
jgi:hypothetical protein